MQVRVVKTQEELNECLAIRRAVFVEEQKVPETEEIDQWDRLPDGSEPSPIHLLLCNDRGAGAATARVIPYGDAVAKIQRVAVRSTFRGQGCGAAIMRAAEEEARRRGYRRVILDAQCQAEGFYQRLGYQRVSDEVFLDAGIEHVRMTKVL